MASLLHVSRRLSITISLGEVEGKNVTKSMSISNIGAVASADILSGLVSAAGALLAYPVAYARVYDTESLEMA